METSRFVIQTEAAEILRVSPRTLERLRVTGEGPRFVKIGRRVLYRASDLEAWADTHTFGSTSEVEAGK